jgi:flagellar assembly protein FliH
MSPSPIPLMTRGPISSICMIDEPAAVRRAPAPDPAALQAQRKKLEQAAEALHRAAEQVEEAGRELFASHREAVIQLALEIAAKILARDIREKNYRIERILNEALRETPAGQVRTIRLHPEDLETYRQYLQEHPAEALPQAHLVGDWSLGAAECIVETEQGLLDWMIEEQVRQVSEALLAPTTEQE